MSFGDDDSDIAPKPLFRPSSPPSQASPRNNGSSFYSWSTLLFEDPRGWKDPRSFQYGVSREENSSNIPSCNLLDIATPRAVLSPG